MSANAYTEDQLVERPAIGLFAKLGWAVAGPPPNAGAAGELRDAEARIQQKRYFHQAVKQSKIMKFAIARFH